MLEDKRRIDYREDYEFLQICLTIERQLQTYERHPCGSERAAVLWRTWQQNKRWLIHLLELTLASFPSYSRHDSSHADAVLHNIERVLGQERIALLSATDCFVILHTVYMHDIGMAILAEDRKKIVKSDEFVDMIDDLASGADQELKEAALLLKKNRYCQDCGEEIAYEGNSFRDEKKKLYKKKLDTYYAVVQLLAEYQRRCHGEKAANSVKEWILGQNKTGTEFTMSGVPMRIFFRIADCASLHTEWDSQKILNLLQEENGYDNDMFHPRFIAVLLQLGDALDIDNDRFHPFAHAFAGAFPKQSQAHYYKHLAIRTLKITSEEIVVEADCETSEAMRLIRNECDWIESLLKFASYYWSSIAPKGFRGALPSFRFSKLLLKGKEIPWDLALSRFHISQQIAFSLLQGDNVYSGRFLFVRELLQNAIDSTKMQCYNDYRTSSKFRFKDSRISLDKPGITNIANIINPAEYPVEICISCCKLSGNNNYQEISLEEIPADENVDEKYGICFSIRDYGIGIDAKTLRNISQTGTENVERKKLYQEIPEWLRPTGEFGIGLQSVFLVNDNFSCETYVRNGERYKIEFLSSADRGNGYINVEPIDTEEEPVAYGTEFRVFVGHEKGQAHKDDWMGQDPFTQGYVNTQIRRNIIALTIQIMLEIDNQLEDLLFPVCVTVKFNLDIAQGKLLSDRLSKIVFRNDVDSPFTEDILKKHMCWIYQNEYEEIAEGNIKKFEISEGICKVDLNQMKIYLWLDELAVSSKIGVDLKANNDSQLTPSMCKIYYKGMLIGEREINKWGNLLEYINIQSGKKGRKFIQLSRNGFTQEGEAYIDSVLIPKIYRSLFDVLKTLARQQFALKGETEMIGFAEKIKKNIIAALDCRVNKFDKIWQKQLVGISLYYNYYRREFEIRNSHFMTKRDEAEREQWEDAIRNVSQAVSTKRNEATDMDIHSRLMVIEVYADLLENCFQVLGKREITIADFYRKENKFAVVSKRRDTGDKWINTLIWLKNSENRTDKTPALIEALEYADTERNKKQGWTEQLENWAEFMLKNIYYILESQPIQQSNFVLALLQSVSISACFSDAAGNFKIHILSGQPRGSVYYNIHAKYKLLKHMASRNKAASAERFAGNVWMGYEPLQIPFMPDDICSIKEQYIQGSETYMIFPCSGHFIQKLIQFAETSEEKYWSQEQTEEMEQRELAVYFMETEDRLRDMAEKLYSCIVIEYNEAKMSDEKLFSEKYVDYCKEQKVRISPMSFWDLLNSGYSLTLGELIKEKLGSEEGKRKSLNSLSVEDLKTEIDVCFPQKQELEESLSKETDAAQHHVSDEERKSFPDEEEINKLRKKIEKGMLLNSKAIIEGRELEGENAAELLASRGELIEYCLRWDYLWKLVQHLQMKLESQVIKKYLLANSEENKNLISWVSACTNNEPYGVAECYDRMWDELIGAVLQRRESGIKDQHFKLLDWMRKKEEHGEVLRNGRI